MVNEIQYTNIRRVLDNLLDHPLLRDLTLEQVVRHTLRFISLHGYSKIYQDKIADVEIKDFRGVLPCDLIRIVQVKDLKTATCMRAMTDSFAKGMLPEKGEPSPLHPSEEPLHKHKDLLDNTKPDKGKPWYIPPTYKYRGEPSFKTQGRIIYTSFPEGKVGISYKAIPIDEDGFPLLIDEETYLAALEAYIKKQVFTVKYDTGKITAGVLQNAQTDYAMLSAQLRTKFTTPSVSEMESYTRYFNSLIPRVREFDNGFSNLGDREYIRRH